MFTPSLSVVFAPSLLLSPVTLTHSPPYIMRRYMHELGRHVPIIPVITKADTMTIREAHNYKQEVYGRLQVCLSVCECLYV